ncbi:MAG TPA: molybdopterin cofactor-binding domain-containing protein, partial [Acetobacteraceae bacterium]|nr:molybdopterin cofactor-binding domain-containing protein [Acetobacteraceae bacterium]
MEEGVGQSVPRLEDERYLRGKGEFIADIRLAGMRDLAFVRSPVAHARIRGVRKPEGAVFAAADLVGVQPIVAVSGLPGFKPSVQPVLASDKVRHVGEPIAVCVADSRAEAEDLAAAVEVDFEELPAVVDMRAALNSPTKLHEHWDNNIFLETFIEVAPEIFARPAPIVVRRKLRTARQCMSPLEGRGVVSTWDRRLEQLLVYTSTQLPHIVRTGLAGCLGLDQARIRIVAPDVGGGFGYKGILLQEEVCAAWLARHLGYPVRWIEDRREQLTGNANCREHDYDLTVYAEADGTLIGIDADAVVDAGAYSAYPFSACLEAAQVASILPGPYTMQAYRCRTFSAATNKPPILPYRGVARAGVCFALEVALDAVARQAGLEPHEVRLRNLVPADRMPFENITKKYFDSGDYPQCLRRVIEAIDLPAVRRRQAEATGAVRIGFGCAIFCEQAAHGTTVYAGWG